MAFLGRSLRGAALLALLTAAVAGACFSPKQPSCAFSCVDDGRCPSGYTCGDDGICHRDDGVGICDIPSLTDGGDGGGDAGAEDGSAD